MSSQPVKDGEKQEIRTREVCPYCGGEKFKVKAGIWSRLLGRRFECGKCGKIFKQASLVQVETKKQQVNIRKPARKNQAKKGKSRR